MKNLAKITTYGIIKNFVKGFAISSVGLPKSMKKTNRKEADSVIDTYFSNDKNTSKELKDFFEELTNKEEPTKIDPNLCYKKYLAQHGEEMTFPKIRCDHCGGYGAYHDLKDDEIAICNKYERIGEKRLSELGLSAKIENLK